MCASDDDASTTTVLYLSPLRALAADIDKNLRAPLIGIEHAADRLGIGVRVPRVGVRTGDTSGRERQQMLRRPPELLITTPESLYLMLTSRAAATLVDVDTVIVDEIHALAPTKRGAHLAFSLERLEEITRRPPQRIGLSATQRPLGETARFLGGHLPDGSGRARPVEIVDAGGGTDLEVEVVVPVEDMGDLGRITTELRSGPATAALVERRRSIWPSIYPAILARVLEHRSTIIFCNARRAAERIAAQLNELASEHLGEAELEQMGGELFRAHHGSLSRDQRLVIEDQLKRGQLRGIVATSSLELGIDMGSVDLVIQVESPGSVRSGLQRIGRAGHQVGVASRGVIFPKHRSDLIETAVVVRRMLEGWIESSSYLRNPLDVLAQQFVAHVAIRGEVSVAELASLARRCANFAELSDGLLVAVLDLLAGRYPSAEFAELRPRLIWDRTTDLVRARAGAQRLAVTSGGTIPDRGLFGVFLPDGTRVGELDEEMVFESRPGETFVLGASTWRIEDISFERVTVTPAPGEPGKMPFWHGDRQGRPAELGRAVGAFQREVVALSGTADRGIAALGEHYGLDRWAAENLVRYLAEQIAATGVVPDDRTLVIERFRDEIGDWRVCILSPFGTPVHAPWAMAIERYLADRYDIDIETMWADDGIVIRLPESIDEIDIDLMAIEPSEIDDIIVASLARSALFSSRFRECAARALLLPRRRPDRRTPLWQQRQRAADLLGVAVRYPDFPILLETSREVLNDVFDLPALRQVLADIRARRIRIVYAETPSASPMASSLLFGWVAAYMYEGDTPLAERRAAALALDRRLLQDLLGAEELRELLDVEALAELETELQCLGASRRARDADELLDLLDRLGDLETDEITARCEGPGIEWLDQLRGERRVIEVVVADRMRWISANDASRYRDALGCALPAGLPAAFTEPVARPLEQLVARYARTHGPFELSAIARHFGIGGDRIRGVLMALVDEGRLVTGAFRPGGIDQEWCDQEVLRRLRRRSIARLRDEVEPVEPVVLARFAPVWHQIPATRGGVDSVAEAIGLLAGAEIVASTLERDVLPMRVRGYSPVVLDELLASGEVIWVGAGPLGRRDGRLRLYFADQVDLAAVRAAEPVDGAIADAIRDRLASRGASFFAQLRLAGVADPELLTVLWAMVWSGEVTNDSLVGLRAFVRGASGARRPARRRPGMPSRTGPPAGAGRWGLVADALAGAGSSTAHLHAAAVQLVERHGVLTRAAVATEATPGGFSAVYGVLKVLEERGQVRRGYFVAGLGGAQFAVPGALDRLRSLRGDDAGGEPSGAPIVLAATDPAQIYGAALAWPETAGRPARVGSAVVVLHAGEPSVWFDRRSHHLVTFPFAAQQVDWPQALVDLVPARARQIEIRKINGRPIADAARDPALAPVLDLVRRAGFTEGYRGLVAPRARA